ncbi:MAG: FliG C-terminal domain-containing protein [Elusimicrobiota bacterium]
MKRIHRWPLWLLAGLLVGGARFSLAKFEQEQLALEAQMQQRIESVLAKTLPPNSYLVTVKIEMEKNAATTSVRSTAGGNRAKNQFLNENRYILPGVPQKKEYGAPNEPASNETVVNAVSGEALIRKMSITVLVAPEITSDQIRAIRDVLSATIPFNPFRGDEMDIQNSPLIGNHAAPPAGGSTVSTTPVVSRGGGFPNGMNDRSTLIFTILLILVAIILLILVAFLFGPVRAFSNRLLAMLPRVGEQAAYAVNSASSKTPSPAQGGETVTLHNGVNGYFGPDSGNGADVPFRFIHENQLNKLPILIRQMSAPQAALVLAYLPPEWASRVLNSLDAEAQSAIMSELSQAREVPSEVVKEVEEQVKSRLPYLVGGVEWIEAVYQLTQPQTQRALLDTLDQQVPELAQSLRQKTFFIEDVNILNPGALRLLVQELGYPATALALKAEESPVREAILSKLPAATREIIQQELEMSGSDAVALQEARTRLMGLGRRLLAEGRISLPERK